GYLLVVGALSLPFQPNTEHRMKTTLLVCSVTLGVAFSFSSTAAVDSGKAEQLTAKYNCQACHAVDKKVVGPSYKDIAKKYAGDNSAESKLEQKVKNGGSGAWGAVPMPPNNVPEADLKTLVTWILSLK